MPNPGESRLPRIGAIAVVLAAVAGGFWWWKQRRASDAPATSAVTQRERSASPKPATARSAPIAPARLTITVTDDNGPLAGATVRLAPKDGEVVVVKTGADGSARSDLDPGAWAVSASAAEHLPAALPARQLAAGADDRVAIKLARGGRLLSGTVSDATGGPVAGARIDAARVHGTPAGTAAEPGDAVATAFTGADGAYRLTIAEGRLLVAAASPDYAPQSRYVELGPAGAVADFSLVPGGTIEGIVRDERTKEPVAGAAVLARRDSAALVLLAETGARRTTSGGDGRFRLSGLRPGAWELDATEHGRAARAQTIVGLGVAEQVSDVELLIGRSPVIRGRVVDGAGAPAPNVRVRAFARGETGEDRADDKGAFALEGLRPGEYVVTADDETYLPQGTAQVALADKDVDDVTVIVKRAHTLKGHVEPRQVCDVQLESGEGQRVLMRLPPGATTGPDGEFALGPLDDGATKVIARCASGDQGQAEVQVARDMPDAVVRVTPGASIAGRVVDGEGKPVVGVVATATRMSMVERMTIRNGMITSGVQGQTDAAGAFKLDGLAPGSYRMSALDRGKPLQARGRAPTVELAASERRTGVEVAIDRPDGVIIGTVTGPDGKPLPDAWVSVQLDLGAMFESSRGDHASEARMMVFESRGDGPGAAPESSFPPALTDAQGRYEIRGLPRAAFAMVAEAQRGQLRGRASGVRPNATIDIRALGVTSLSGTVTGAAGPSALFSVELDGPTRAQRSFTDGKFTFDRVDPGRYTVRVQSSDGNAEARVEVAANAAASVDIQLAANAVVIGKLVDPAGQPLAGQAVALAPDAGDGQLRIEFSGPPPTTGPDGSFRIEHRAERVVLIVMRPPRPFSKRGLVLEAGKTLDLGTVTVDTPAAPPAPPAPRQ